MSTIENNVTAKNFRLRAEDKNTLSQKGSMYVGTGNKSSEDPTVCETVAIQPVNFSPDGRYVLTNNPNPDEQGGLMWHDIVDTINEDSLSNIAYAESARTAEYAKGGENKGTIEERLTNLGFKEGSITLSGAIASSSVVQNKITRQGNYCLFNLDLSGVNISVDYQNPKFIGNLSSNFLPLETYYGSCYVSTDDTTDPFLLKISETGDVYLMESGTSSATISNLQAIGLGYEAKPLS